MNRPIAYVINLNRRQDRWARCQEVWTPIFDLVRVPATATPNGADGCKISHLAAVSLALEKDEMAIVMEDDCEPTIRFARLGMRCIQEARSRVDNWDVICCGPYLNLEVLGIPKAVLSRTESPLFLSTTFFHQTHFMLYNHRSIKLLINSQTSRLPLDMFLGFSNSMKLVPVRLLATQNDSPSDIHKPALNTADLYAKTEEMMAATVPEDDLP